MTKLLKGIPRRRRHFLCAAALFPVFATVHAGAYWLRFEGAMEAAVWRSLGVTVVWAVLIKLLVFGWFRVYQGWSRYITFHDLIVLVKAATASSLLMLLANYLFHPGLTTARSVFLLDWAFTLVVVGGLQSLVRFLEEGKRSVFLTLGRKPVFIVGANDSGEALLRTIRRNPKLPYWVAGFVAEREDSLQTQIGGVPVLGVLEQTCQLAKQYEVAEVLIAAGELPGQQVRRLVDEGRQSGVSVIVLPSYEQLLRGNLHLRPREVSIEDLLRRDPVQLNLTELHRWIDNRTLLVTGSAGSIGSEICRQLLAFSPRQLVLVDRWENGQFFLERELRSLAPEADIAVCIGDVTDERRMDCLFEQHRPEIVFHAAAYKHVPLMEANPGEGVKNICLATRTLANAADRHGVSSFVTISTDKAVNPTSVMGACKRVAELYVQALAQSSACQFVTVRFGNVLDSAGSVVPIFRQQIAAGGPVTVTHPDMVRFFMTIPEASQLVIQAGAMGRGGEIFVLDMGEPVKIVDLATDMIRLSGLELGRDIEIEFMGTRPGEKLFEELHCDGEVHQPTSHAKIMIANSVPVERERVAQAIRKLERLADTAPAEAAAELHRLVRESHRAGVEERTYRRAA
jgi:FlaA1/EpsC-like NDP-sugar epimerase